MQKWRETAFSSSEEKCWSIILPWGKAVVAAKISQLSLTYSQRVLVRWTFHEERTLFIVTNSFSHPGDNSKRLYPEFFPTCDIWLSVSLLNVHRDFPSFVNTDTNRNWITAWGGSWPVVEKTARGTRQCVYTSLKELKKRLNVLTLSTTLLSLKQNESRLLQTPKNTWHLIEYYFIFDHYCLLSNCKAIDDADVAL